MSIERKWEDIDIEFLAATAKEKTLKFGYHVPTVIAVGSLGTVLGQISGEADSSEERARAMRVLGRAFQKAGKLGDLHRLYFISEGWMSEVEGPEKRINIKPSQDPNRKEILLISELNLIKRQTNLILFEMERNENGELVAIDTYKNIKGDLEAKAYLLEEFVQGFNQERNGGNGNIRK